MEAQVTEPSPKAFLEFPFFPHFFSPQIPGFWQFPDTHPFFPVFFLDSTGVGGGEGECFLFLVLAAAFLSLLSGLRTGWEGAEV